MMHGFRKDNRVFSFPRIDRTSFEAAGAGVAHPLSIQMTGTEPLLIAVTDDCAIGYTNTGPWINLFAGTMMTWEVNHPFRGDLFFKCDTAGDLPTVQIDFMIGGYVNVEE